MHLEQSGGNSFLIIQYK